MPSPAAKLAALRAARQLRAGQLVAHYTATLPGVAADPRQNESVRKLISYKQRRGPFLLLADSVSTALALARWLTPFQRQMARKSWPGATTLIISARPGLPAACYQSGRVAVRVDASLQVRQLARACGGLLISSSLNRRGGMVGQPGRRHHYQHHRHLGRALSGPFGSGHPSTLLRLGRNDFTVIRP